MREENEITPAPAKHKAQPQAVRKPPNPAIERYLYDGQCGVCL